MKRVALYTKNERLGRKFELILASYATVDILSGADDASGYSAVFVDRESLPEVTCGISLPFDGTRTLPFLFEDVISLVRDAKEQNTERRLRLLKDDKCVILGDERIQLTDLEFKLLDTLMSRSGFVDRKTLVNTVWGEGFDGGILTVYIHYLREKLEKQGEKIIMTSRAEGYAIDGRFKG